MARKDVDLVIRAKDEAGNALDAITDAINAFIGASGKMGKTGKETSGVLQTLGKSVADLQKEFKGLDVGERVANDMNKAGAAMKQLKTDFVAAEQESKRLVGELEAAGVAAAELAKKTDDAAKAQAKSAKALKAAQVNQKAQAAGLKEAEQALAKLVTAEERQTVAVAKQEANLAKIQARYEQLGTAVAAAEKPTKVLATSFQSATDSLAKNTTKLADMKAALAGTGQAIGTTAAKIETLSVAVATGAANVDKQTAAFTKVSAKYQELGTQAKSAAAQQGAISVAAEKQAASVAKLGGQLEKTEVEFAQFSAASGKLSGAMNDLAGQSTAKLTEAFTAQRRAMLLTKKEWLDSQAALAKLSEEMSAVGVPTQKMAESFTTLRAAAALAKQEYIAQRDGLQKLGSVLKEEATDITSLAQKQSSFQAALAQTGQALSQVRAQAQASSGGYNLLSGNANRAGIAVGQAASASKAAGQANSSGAAATSKFAKAYNDLYGGSRQSLGLIQRLRGEVLSLIASYVGFYGVINILGKVVESYNTLQSASTRLNVAFNADPTKVANELDFVRRNADRLGIQFGVLATEYSKFAISTQGTELAGEATRKIFIAVAEAARVNNSSTEETAGVFTALTQIVSKGAVQMEELRQQLGDRLPGALQLMADGLGVTTAELIKMMQAGEVTSKALIPFADQLIKKYGPGLAKALLSTSTQLGRLGNEAQKAEIQFGNAGFIDAFNRLLATTIKTMQSIEFQSFVQRASVAFGAILDLIGTVISNFRLVGAAITALTVLLGGKLAKYILGLVVNFGNLKGSISGVILGVRGMAGAFTATGAAAAGGATGVRAFGLALKGVLASTGIGLVIAAVATGIELWATRADKATEALDAHQKMVDEVRNAYDAAGGANEKFFKSISDISKGQAQASLANLQASLKSLKDEATGLFNDTGASIAARRSTKTTFGFSIPDAKKQYDAIQDLNMQFARGGVAAKDYKASLDAIAQGAVNPALKAYALELEGTADKAGDMEDKVRKAQLVLDLFSGDADKAAAAAKALSGAAEEAGDGLDKGREATEKFNKAMDELVKLMPELQEGFERVDTSKLETAFQAAAQAATSMGQLNRALGEFQKAQGILNQNAAMKDYGKFTDGTEATKQLLRDREGFQPTAKFDVNHYRAGYGSDTVTLADNSVHEITQGMKVSVEDAERDLSRRVQEFTGKVISSVGQDKFAGMTPQQQAALTSIAYNYGSLPEKLAAVIKNNGTDSEVADAIRNLGNDNGGVNRERRQLEAGLFDNPGQYRTQADTITKKAADDKKEKDKNAADTKEELADNETKIKQQQLINDGKGKEAAIIAAEAEARKKDPAISDTDIAKIKEQAGQIYELSNATKGNTAATKEAQEAMKQVNALIAQRTALQAQLKAQLAAGDVEGAASTKDQIASLGTKIDETIAKAREMWTAIGGHDADITKLDTAAIKTETLKTKAKETYLDWSQVGELFASGLTNAFDQFAEAVANGTSIGEAARTAFLQFASDFLKQIAQMIIKQAILNAISSFTGGGAAAGGGGLLGGIFGHTGGRVGSKSVGSGNNSRQISPLVFAGAARFHTGGFPGLKPDEVPLIAQQGEEILAKSDPRNALNGAAKPGGASHAPAQDVKIINTFDAASFISEGLNSKVGQKALLNYVSANPRAFKSALGS